MQGDIVAVYNQSGTKLISYTYDAWGATTTAYLIMEKMMNGAGQSIYKELGRALAKSGLVSAGINVAKSIYGRITQ